MNTPHDAGDDTINALAELEHEIVYLRSPPAEEWHFDIGEDGEALGTCPRCSHRGRLTSARDTRVQCVECGHIDGDRYELVGFGPFEPPESVRVPYTDPDEE